MGGIFGGGKSGGGEKAASGILDQQRQLTNQYLQRYSDRFKLFSDAELARNEFGSSFFPWAQQQVYNPTLSPAYQLHLKEGINFLRNNAALTGSPSGGPGQIQVGRFAAGLAGHELDKSREVGLAGMRERGVLPRTQEPDFLEQMAGLTRGYASAVQADKQENSFNWGGLFGSVVPQVFGHFFP